MEVYIEYVIINNFIIDFILLLLLSKLLVEKTLLKGIVLGSILGSIIAVITPLLPFEGILLVLFRILSGAVIVLVGRLKFQNIMIASLLFYMLTFLFGGLVIGLDNLLNMGNNLSFLRVIPPPLIIGGLFLCAYVSVFLYKKIVKRAKIAQFNYDVKVVRGDVQISLTAYLDSGNLLVDFISSKVVVITTLRAVCDIVDLTDFLKLPTLDISTATSSKDKIRLKEIDSIMIYKEGVWHTYSNVILGLVLSKLGEDGEIDMLLSPLIFE